jgi:Ca-activated chloride channel family protein
VAIAWGSTLKTTRGGEAALVTDDGSVLEIADDATVVLGGTGAARSINVERGTAALEVAKGASAARVRLVDRTANVAPGASIAVRAASADRAELSVRRGVVTLEAKAGEGDATTLGVGQTAAIRLSQPIDDRATWSAAVVAPPARTAAPTPAIEAPAQKSETPEPIVAPRGLGSMTARVPGTTAVIGGVRLIAHKVDVLVRDGFARTTVEEEFKNDTDRVLEGRYAFALPASASVSRLALWVGINLMEGEIVERDTAKRIFQGIVEDTVRPRDPALLEWVSGGEVALKIFPLPPRGSRKVVLAYDQALVGAGNRVQYAYPLALGSDRAVSIDDFSMHVRIVDSLARVRDLDTPRYAATIGERDGDTEITYTARSFAPSADFNVTYEREPRDATRADRALVSAYVPRRGEPGSTAKNEDQDAFAAVRFTVALPDDVKAPTRQKQDRVIVVDTSYSQSRETLAGTARLTEALLRDLGEGERFTVLACDSACVAYPEDGLATPTEDNVAAATKWLSEKRPTGSSNVAGALLDAAHRLHGSQGAQIVYVGDGAPTSGELSTETIAARVKPALDDAKADLRLLGAGRAVDEVVLGGLSRAVGATFERVATGQALADRAESIVMGLRKPIVRGATVELPEGLTEVYPKSLPNLRVGDEVVLVGKLSRLAADAKLTLNGDLQGAKLTLKRPLAYAGELASINPMVPRLWAEARIADLAVSPAKEARDETIALSKRFHVMSRATSLLVLENDQMYSAFGIQRTKQPEDSTSPFAGPVATPPMSPSALAAVPPPSPGTPSAPWGSDLGSDPMSARGNMWGTPIGDSFGAGGLGLSGIGEGGGGRGEGIGLGQIGTLGHAAGSGDAQGFGSGTGRLSGQHKSSSPSVRMGGTSVSGRLPPEVIQRIVRQNFGRFRLCYENGLRNNPNLSGRVSVRFLINESGSVSSVANGGSDLPDSGVIACVVRSFSGLSFPQPDAGSVTVTFPIVFAPEGGGGSGPPPRWRADPWWAARSSEPSAFHAKGDGTWRTAAAPSIDKVRASLDADPSSRSKRESYVRELLKNGRFDQALTEAERFASLDPDSPIALELVGFSHAARGEGDAAVRAIDALVESSPRSASVHARAARALEAAGDERRACAHWRSLSELEANNDEARAESVRCRARVESDKDGALAEARAIEKPGSLLVKAIELLTSGNVIPAHDSGSAHGGQMEATISCATGVEHCPTIVVLTPTGSILSPWTPGTTRAARSRVSFSGLRSGTYRTLVVGGARDARADIEIRALGSTRKFPLLAVPSDLDGVITVAKTTVNGV